MKSAEIRQAFLDYFKQNGHEIVPSSPLIPANDPTLLFTNAGMVQFKETFLGLEKRPYSRATSSQRCVRAGGKHNDLENVGYTARHHTFFEMLGNFSFGDYFKREAIQYAWEFLTKTLNIPQEKLWVTVYKDDDEAADIWLNEIKIDPQRFTRCGEEDNFWSMGDTGPCGPCSEIFYDHGEDIPGGPPGSADAELDRYIEIWNLVFMQFDRDKAGKLTPLPKPSVDTGMGLERIAAVMQGVHDNYDIDLFQNLLKAIAHLIDVTDTSNKSMRVIADHIRSCSFLIVDGVMPSNEGRGYVLRRIIRRAIRHGHKLGQHDIFFYKLVAPLVKEMGDAYPELKQSQAIVEKLLKQEEEQFIKTLDQGLKIFEQDIESLKNNVIPGETIFRLYDTYGFPVDLTGDIARERGLELDIAGFETAMQQQRERSQAASHFETQISVPLVIEGETIFTGYEHLQHGASVTALFREGEAVDALKQGEVGAIVLDSTPFYAESGGQVGDQGLLKINNNQFSVRDTQKQGQVILHYGEVTLGEIKLNDEIHVEVDLIKRRATMLNHSATHLLHSALRKVLGEHVQQKGSLVDPSRLRFDFSHFSGLKSDELSVVERMVNEQIRFNLAADVTVMSPEEAKQAGAIALFGEKYGDKVRVMRFGDFSKELCGGTHVDRTGDIGLFKIISETGIAAGVRRIEAVTGDVALDWLSDIEKQLDQVAANLKTNREHAFDKVQQLIDRNRDMEKELSQLKSKFASAAGSDLASKAIDINGIKFLAHKLEGVDAKALRDTCDQLKQKLGTAVIVLGLVQGEKVNLIAGVTKDCIDKVKAGDIVNFVAQQVGGKGGGRPDMAQAGGNQPQNLDKALASVKEWLEQQIS